MPKKRHSPEQIAAALRQAEAGTPIAEITRKLGVHENTFYLWKKRYGQLVTPEIRELGNWIMCEVLGYNKVEPPARNTLIRWFGSRLLTPILERLFVETT